MDALQTTLDPAYQFAKDSYRFVKRCTKPDRRGIIYLRSGGLLPQSSQRSQLLQRLDSQLWGSLVSL